MGQDFISKTAPTFELRRSRALEALREPILFDQPVGQSWTLKALWLSLDTPIAAGSECLLEMENEQLNVVVGGRRVGVIMAPAPAIRDRIRETHFGHYPAAVERTSTLGRSMDIRVM